MEGRRREKEGRRGDWREGVEEGKEMGRKREKEGGNGDERGIDKERGREGGG